MTDSSPVDRVNAPAPEADDNEEAPRIELTGRKVAAFALFVVVAVAAMYFLLPRIAGLDETWHRIEQGSPAWLALAALLMVGMFAGYVFLFHAVYSGVRLRVTESYQITMAALAASRLLSAGGAGGLVLQAWALRRAGMQPRVVADRTVSFIVMTYLVYMLALLVCGYGLYFGLLPGRAPFGVTFIPATLALLVTAVGLSIGFVPTDLQRRLSNWCDKGGGRKKLLVRLAQVPATASAGVRDALRRVVSLDAALLGAIVFWGCQVGVLWASFRAFGESPPAAVLIMGFFVGMLGNLLPLPGGIGGVDGGMITAFTAFGVDFGLATVAVLVYRGFTFWLPTVPGIIAYLQLRKTVERWRLEHRKVITAAV